MRISAAYTSIVIALLSANSVADEQANDAPEARDSEVRPIEAALPATLLEQWQIDDLGFLEIDTYSSNFVSSLDDDFLLKSSVIIPAGAYRSLSLITFAEMGKARLFLGVNSEGLLGFHFNALPKPGKDTDVEVVRMPYLESRDRADDGEVSLTRSSRRAR